MKELKKKLNEKLERAYENGKVPGKALNTFFKNMGYKAIFFSTLVTLGAGLFIISFVRNSVKAEKD